MTRREEILKGFDSCREYTQDRVKNGIETYRKGGAYVRVVDGEGKPVPGARISIEQKSHAFKYGANLFMLDQMETAEKNEAYKKNFVDAFNLATLPFYWRDVEPEQGKLRFDKDSEFRYRRPPIDACIEFCREHGIEPREHALAYEHTFPAWLKGMNRAQVWREYERRCRQMAERYADKVPTIEVTNESFWNESVTPIFWEKDFIADCYKIAAKYFTHNELVINEWTNDAWTKVDKKFSRYFVQIENALLKGARIDAIGMQYHMFYRREDEAEKTRDFYNPMHLYQAMDAYACLGKPLQVTEVTVPSYSWEKEDEEIQAEIIEQLYSIWFSHPAMEQIVYWNLVDGYAAAAEQGDMKTGENYYYGGLMRFDLTPKPAYETIRRLFGKTWHTSAAAETDRDGRAWFKGFYGGYEAGITVNGKETTVQFDLARDGAKEITVEV